MSLANLFNVPRTEQELLIWSFSNQAEHNLIINAILTQKGVVLNNYPLDPIPMFDVDSWARGHQSLHNDFTAVLGIAGVDLTDISFKDEGRLASFIRLHGNEHLLAAAKLGIS